MSVSSTLGAFGSALFALAVALRLIRIERIRDRGMRFAVAGLIALSLFAPLNGLPVVLYLRSLVGDLSASTLILAAAACAGRLTGLSLAPERDHRALCWLLTGAAAFLYPLALGLGPFDPYSLGYQSPTFVAVLLLVALGAWYANMTFVVVVIVVGLALALAGAYESNNLWDYLMDPVVCGYAAIRSLASLIRGSNAVLRHFWPTATTKKT